MFLLTFFFSCLGLILQIFFPSFVFLDYISPFNICCKAGLVVLNSLNFCLPEKLLIPPLILKDILVWYSNLGCSFFPFSTLNISFHFLLAYRVSAKRSLLNVWGFPCMLLVASPSLLLTIFLCVSIHFSSATQPCLIL